MKSTASSIKLSYSTIFPKVVSNFNHEMQSCIEQIKQLESESTKILYYTAFVSCLNTEDYQHKKKEISTSLKSISLAHIIPLSVVAQSPEQHQACFEVALINADQTSIEPRKINDTDYLLAHFPEQTLVIALGLSGNINRSIKEQSETVFKSAEAVLQAEGLSFANVVRQWNYIEDITGELTEAEKLTQNYQVFNDVRSEHYDKSDFTNGYPAATGIGMQSGGIIIDFIAAKNSNQVQIIPLTNPAQIDAHKYSDKVLVGNDQKEKTTPKFERAKALYSLNQTTIFVSGTAAIYGENTVKASSIEEQTIETINIIDNLINLENQDKHDITPNELCCDQIRMYVRQGENSAQAIKIVKEKYPDTQVITVTGNVCRNDLAVEIEAVYSNA
ncbi:MAG: hypothetical protein OCD00_12710 [Colwellia sp.]